MTKKETKVFPVVRVFAPMVKVDTKPANKPFIYEHMLVFKEGESDVTRYVQAQFDYSRLLLLAIKEKKHALSKSVAPGKAGVDGLKELNNNLPPGLMVSHFLSSSSTLFNTGKIRYLPSAIERLSFPEEIWKEFFDKEDVIRIVHGVGPIGFVHTSELKEGSRAIITTTIQLHNNIKSIDTFTTCYWHRKAARS